MDLYSLEIYACQLKLSKLDRKVNPGDMIIRVICKNLFNFKMSNTGQTKLYDGGIWGMLTIFPCNKSTLVSDLQTNLQIQLLEVETEIGSFFIKFNSDFDKKVQSFEPGDKSFMEHSGKYRFYDKKKKVVTDITIEICLSYFGPIIQLPITTLVSELNIPIPHRQISSQSDILCKWKPPLTSQEQMRPEDSTNPPHLRRKFYPDTKYLNENLCGQIKCAATRKFKKLGLGPLAYSPKTTETVKKNCNRCYKCNKNSTKPVKKCSCKNCKKTPKPEELNNSSCNPDCAKGQKDKITLRQQTNQLSCNSNCSKDLSKKAPNPKIEHINQIYCNPNCFKTS